MNPLLTKLNFKAHRRVLVVAAPPEAASLLALLRAEAVVSVDPRTKGPFDFALVFTRNCAEVSRAVAAAQLLAEDAPFWCCYPKLSSKKYASDLSRDRGWQPLGDLGFEPVRQVALDEDWSALRFRKAERIKTLTRSADFAMSAVGKARASRKKRR
jgi:hypothetical protein